MATFCFSSSDIGSKCRRISRFRFTISILSIPNTNACTSSIDRAKRTNSSPVIPGTVSFGRTALVSYFFAPRQRKRWFLHFSQRLPLHRSGRQASDMSAIPLLGRAKRTGRHDLFLPYLLRTPASSKRLACSGKGLDGRKFRSGRAESPAGRLSGDAHSGSLAAQNKSVWGGWWVHFQRSFALSLFIF